MKRLSRWVPAVGFLTGDNVMTRQGLGYLTHTFFSVDRGWLGGHRTCYVLRTKRKWSYQENSGYHWSQRVTLSERVG